jgi:hypothetical protein
MRRQAITSNAQPYDRVNCIRLTRKKISHYRSGVPRDKYELVRGVKVYAIERSRRMKIVHYRIYLDIATVWRQQACILDTTKNIRP